MVIFARSKTKGEMPEWSIGPHSKCGVRVTVPGVRIPLSPLNTPILVLSGVFANPKEARCCFVLYHTRKI